MIRRILGSLALALIAMGCVPGASSTPGLVPAPTGAGYELLCGPMAPEDCLRTAGEALSHAQRQYPDKRVVSISITGPDGDYDLQFDDGTGISGYVN